MAHLKPLALIPLSLCAFNPSTSSAATIMGDYGISTTGYIATGSVSLTTGATTWGYISSTGSYLPNLATNTISVTTVSASSLTLTNIPTATTDATNKAYVDAAVAAASCGSGTPTCRLGRNWAITKTVNGSITPLTSYTGMQMATDGSIYYVGYPSGGNYNLYRDATLILSGGSNVTNIHYFSISTNGQVIAVADNNYKYVRISTNAGTSWSSYATSSITGGSESIISIAVSPDGSRILVDLASNGLYRTANNGTSWTKLATNTNLNNLRYSADMATVMALSSPNNFAGISYISRDGGATWTTLAPTWTEMSLDGTRFIGLEQTTSGKYSPKYSMDGGATWTVAGEVMDTLANYNMGGDGKPSMSPDGKVMVVGPYASFDSGATWQKFDTTQPVTVSRLSGRPYYFYAQGSYFNLLTSTCP